MANQIPPVTDDYIASVIKSNDPFDPNLNKTQGVKVRELLKNLRDYTLQEIGDISAGLTDITYAQLITAIAAGTLKPGSLYRLTDFQTTHNIVPVATPTLHIGPVEPLIFLAVTSTHFSNRVWSQTYPQDVLTYTTDNSYIAGATKGCILERYDTVQNVRVRNDFRNVVYRRWKLIANPFNQANAYPFGATAMGPDGAWYYVSNLAGFAAGTAPTPTPTDDNWAQFYPDNNYYYSRIGTGSIKVNLTSIQAQTYPNPAVPVDSASFIDCPVFQNYGTGFANIDILSGPGQMLDFTIMNDNQAVIVHDLFINTIDPPNVTAYSKMSSVIVLKGSGYMLGVKLMDSIQFSAITSVGSIRNWSPSYIVFGATMNLTTIADCTFSPFYGLTRGTFIEVFGFRLEYTVTPSRFTHTTFPSGMGNLKFNTNANVQGWNVINGLGASEISTGTIQSSTPDVIVDTAMSWRTFIGFPDFTSAAAHEPSTDLKTQIDMAKKRHIIYAYEEPSFKSIFHITNGSPLAIAWQTDLAPVNLSSPSGTNNTDKRIMTYFTRHGNDFQVQQKDLIGGTWVQHTPANYAINSVDENNNVVQVIFTPTAGATESRFIIV